MQIPLPLTPIDHVSDHFDTIHGRTGSGHPVQLPDLSVSTSESITYTLDDNPSPRARQSSHHYPGRPLPRPPAQTARAAAIVDSTFAPHPQPDVNPVQANHVQVPVGLLVDFGETERRSVLPQRGHPLLEPTAVGLNEPHVDETAVASPRVDTGPEYVSDPPAGRGSSREAPFLELTDLDLLVSRLDEERRDGTDYEVEYLA